LVAAIGVCVDIGGAVEITFGFVLGAEVIILASDAGDALAACAAPGDNGGFILGRTSTVI
jgi:hypothetical protein